MKQIKDYILEDQPIGVGGMGQVLKGTDRNGVPIAIKEILPEYVMDMEFRARLNREIEILRRLNSNNVVKIYDYFEMDGRLYIVMELVDGMNVEKIIATSGPIPPENAIQLMGNILTTMGYIHECGIIHRDIKPSNIMVRPDNDVCILDFGIAKDMTSSGLTQFGAALGTTGYMSPEQAEGMAVDHRTDIYALGCLFFYMLTGKHAYPPLSNEIEWIDSIKSNPIPKLANFIPNVPKGLQEILERATHKNMMKRYQSAREMNEDLKKLSSGGTHVDGGPANVTISIGREGCDLTVFPLKGNISRHHADIQYKVFTGGEFLIYTDCSSNGTLIDGKRITRGVTQPIPMDSNPEILLAGDPECRLELGSIRALIKKKVREQKREFLGEDTPSLPQQPQQAAPAPQQPGGYPQQPAGYPHPVGPQPPSGYAQPYGPNPYDPYAPKPFSGGGPAPGYSFLEAVSACFNKYCTFRGRASRSEYWWFALFNMLVPLVFALLMILSWQLGLALMGLYSLAVILPSLAVTVRRLHDTNHSGWWYLLNMVPFGGIVIFIWLVSAGTPGPNNYDF